MANKGKPKFPTFLKNLKYYKNNDFWMLKRKTFKIGSVKSDLDKNPPRPLGLRACRGPRTKLLSKLSILSL